MAESLEFHFITWPDGKVDGASLNVYSQAHAWIRIIRTWLPAVYFGDLTCLEGYAGRQLWDEMQKKGFKAHSISMKIGTPELVKS